MGRTLSRWDDEAAEGHASGLLSDAGLDAPEIIVPPLLIGYGLHIAMSPIVQSRCRGLLDVSEWKVRYDGRGDPQTVDQNLMHEFGHLAPLCGEVTMPHCERCVDRTAMALWMPRPAVERIVRRVGVNVPALLAAMSQVPPMWALHRIAWVLGRPIICRTGSAGREAWAPDGWETMPDHVERNVVNGVRASGRVSRVRWGGVAWPCEAIGRGGVVIIGECDEMR